MTLLVGWTTLNYAAFKIEKNSDNYDNVHDIRFGPGSLVPGLVWWQELQTDTKTSALFINIFLFDLFPPSRHSIKILNRNKCYSNDIASFLKKTNSKKFYITMKMPPQTLVYTTGGWADASARKELWEYDAVEFTCANLNDRYYEISGEASYDPTFVAATQMQIVSADGEDDSDNLEENTLVDDQNYNATSFDED